MDPNELKRRSGGLAVRGAQERAAERVARRGPPRPGDDGQPR